MTARSVKLRTRARIFFILAFGWSILFWTLSEVLGGIDQFPGSILQYVGGAGPLVAALILVHFLELPTFRREFWSRTFDPRRIPRRWVAAALLVHPIILFVTIALDSGLGGKPEIQTATLTDPVAMMSLVFFVFIFGPLPEEMGWRGVGFETLLRRFNALSASLLLGTAWAAWHIPLFLIDGTFQNQLGFGSIRFWLFLASNVPLTVIITWVYNHTDRSILSAALVHFSGNIIGALLTKTDRFALIELVGLSIVATVLVLRLGADLRYRDRPRSFPHQ